MRRILNILTACFCVAPVFVCAAVPHSTRQTFPQETGFLNRTVKVHGVTYRFQVYLPEAWQRDDKDEWPILLFLHGRGERGSEGMWQTQVGLPEEVRDHPERWPFIIVMPQCPQLSYWTDRSAMAMAMAALDQETREFHADPDRTYLSGLSLGGYGAWELARTYPKRWAAVAIASGGIFWSYAPQRWKQSATLPGEYARAMGKLPVWLFHGSDDPIVPLRESELMFAAFKANNGHIRLWIYQGLKHDSWTRAYNEPDLPRWLLEHRLDQTRKAYAERTIIPLHPPALHLSAEQMDEIEGDYRDIHGLLSLSLFVQGGKIYQKDLHGAIAELAAESPNVLFYPNGNSISRLLVERDGQGRITGLTLHDDRYDERLERIRSKVRNTTQQN